MFSDAFWKDTTERATKTFVQGVVAAVPVSALVTGLDWGDVGNGVGVAAIAAAISVLTSIGSRLRGNPESASLVDTTE